MNRRKIFILMCSLLAVAVGVWSLGTALAAKPTSPAPTKDQVAKYLGKVTPSEQKAAAKAAKEGG